MPSHRASWAEHGEEGWYIGPAVHHYQCYKVLIKRTKGIRTPPSVKFFPEQSKMPSNSSTDRIIEAAKQLTEAINNPAPPVPFEYVGDEETVALKKLAAIFSKKINKNNITEVQNQPNNKDPSSTPIQQVQTPIQRVRAPVQRVS